MKRIDLQLNKLALSVLMLGVLGGQFPGTIQAQDSITEKYLGDSNGLVFEVDLTKLMDSTDFQPLAELIDTSGNIKRGLGFSIKEIKVFAGSLSGPNELPSERFILQSTKDIDPLALMRLNRWLPRNAVPDTRQFRDKTYYQIENRRGDLGVYQPDDKTLIVNKLEVIEDLVKGRRPKQEILRSKDWDDLSQFHAKFALGEVLFEQWRAEYKRFNELNAPRDPLFELIGPLNQKLVKAFGGVRFDESLSFRVSLYAANSGDAKEIDASLQALLQVGKTMLGPLKKNMIDGARDEASKKIATESIAILDKLIDSLDIKRIGREVRITAKVDVRQFVKNVLPDAIQAAQVAARRAQSVNNMKQLGLSMHNYHDVYKKMPPAVIIGPKGHRHSWRIAVLPFIEHKELYDQYRLDEPWDSPNNKKVMEKMPAVFRHPNDPEGSYNTRYLAFVGPGSPFANPEGVQFRDIRDGTSNTIMFFSGPSNVPWTKPQDIDYDPSKAVNTKDGPFKHGFNAVLFDGSVRFFPEDIDPEKLHRMIQGSDGQAID